MALNWQPPRFEPRPSQLPNIILQGLRNRQLAEEADREFEEKREERRRADLADVTSALGESEEAGRALAQIRGMTIEGGPITDERYRMPDFDEGAKAEPAKVERPPVVEQPNVPEDPDYMPELRDPGYRPPAQEAVSSNVPAPIIAGAQGSLERQPEKVSFTRAAPYRIAPAGGQGIFFDPARLRQQRQERLNEKAAAIEAQFSGQGADKAFDDTTRQAGMVAAGLLRSGEPVAAKDVLGQMNAARADILRRDVANQNADIRNMLAEEDRKREALRAALALKLESKRQAGATEREGMKQEGATTRRGMPSISIGIRGRSGGGGGGIGSAAGVVGEKVANRIGKEVNQYLTKQTFDKINAMDMKTMSLADDVISGNPAKQKAAMGEWATMAQSKFNGNRLTDFDTKFFNDIGGLGMRVESAIQGYMNGQLPPDKAKMMEEALRAWARQAKDRLSVVREGVETLIDEDRALNPAQQAALKNKWVGAYFGGAGRYKAQPAGQKQEPQQSKGWY